MTRYCKAAQVWAISLAATFALGCDGVTADIGRDQPLQVANATLIAGQLAAPPADEPKGPLQVTAVELTASIIAGEQRTLVGRTTDDAAAVALQWADTGSGYWVLPVEGVDPQFPGERGWSAQVALGEGVSHGLRKLRVAAVGLDGKRGPSRDVQVCVGRSFADNLNACDPTRQPPALVVQLSWDRDADVDLEVVRPDGSVLSGKSAGKANLPSPQGTLGIDSGASCAIDGLRSEHAIWTDAPLPGQYTLRVRLFNACGQPAVRVVGRVLQRAPGAQPGTWTLVEIGKWDGQLLAGQADGGAGPGRVLAAWQQP